jgi:hypothetical protein
MTTAWAAKRTELGTPCFLPCYSTRCFVLDSKHTSHHRQAIKAPQATAFNCLTLAGNGQRLARRSLVQI